MHLSLPTGASPSLHAAPQKAVAWRIGIWLCCLAGWLLADFYLGVRHDGLLYLGQTLNRLNPSLYQEDLFLSLSGQDRFTIATALIGELYQWMQIGTAQLLILACTQLALAAGVWHWLRPLGWVTASTGLMMVAVTTRAYSPGDVFHVAERFVTARSLAEPVVLAGMLAVLHGRNAWGLALLLLGSLLHPLMAAPAWAWWWMLRLPEDRRLWALPALAVAGLFLGAMGVPGLAAIVQRFDVTWWAIVERRNEVLVGSYAIEGWADAGAVGLLAVASRWAPAPLSQGLRALATIAVLLAGATAWGADLFRFVLVTQLQLLRVMWLVQLLATALLPWLLWQAWHQRGAHGQIWALTVAATATAANARLEMLWVYLLSAALASALLYTAPSMRERMKTSLLLAAGLLLLLACAGSWSQFLFSSRLYAPFATHLGVLALVATPPLSVGAIALLHHARIASLARYARGAWLPLSVLPALIYGGMHWDQRSPFTRSVEAAGPAAVHPWQAMIPTGHAVYWLHGESATWTLLKRPVYGSSAQGAAALFNRDLALRYDRQIVPFRDMHERAMQCRITYSFMGLLDYPGCDPKGLTLEALCGQLPGFRFFVTANEPAPRTSLSTWRPPGKGLARNDYVLHDCALLGDTPAKHTRPAARERKTP